MAEKTTDGQMELTEADPVKNGQDKGSTAAPNRASVMPEIDGVTEVPKPSTRAQRQEAFLPVTGFVWLYPEEVKVVDHPAFQRLGRIYQLGQTYLVYRGATHKRIEHALGALRIVQRMIDAVRHTTDKAVERETIASVRLSMSEERFVRLGALLHDIGHIAAGHTVEDELRLLGKHDADQRLEFVLGEAFQNLEDRTLAQLIDQEYQQYVPPELGETSPSEILQVLIRKPPMGADPLASAQETLEASNSLRTSVCRDLIGNTICADLLDYLHRDWYHIGKPRPFDERILQYMEIRPGTDRTSTVPVARASDQFVISLGQRPKIRTDAVSAILELLEWRYQLAESVLFHRTKLAAAAMLDRALFELWGGADTSEIERTLIDLSDEEMLSTCARLAREKGGARGEVAQRLLSDLKERNLYSHVLTRFHDDLLGDVRTSVQQKFCAAEGGSAAAERNRALRVLESDFGLPPGAFVMYCPPAQMNAKIAEVKIAVGPIVAKFCDYEEDHSNQLSGGHLEAQLGRFQRLWRVHFFVDRRHRKAVRPYLSILRTAIDQLVLGNVPDSNDPKQNARDLAVLLASREGSPWHGNKTRGEAQIGAYRDAEAATGIYPFGAPSIRSYLDET